MNVALKQPFLSWNLLQTRCSSAATETNPYTEYKDIMCLNVVVVAAATASVTAVAD